MARPPKLTSFFRLPSRFKGLALEAGGELVRARLDTLRPAAHYTRHLGELGGEVIQADPAQEAMALEIGFVVDRVADKMPFRALCLQRALATRRMLRRRGVPATVYLGLLRDPVKRRDATDGSPAHAWVQTGTRVVSGDDDLDRFAIVGAFT